MVFQANLIDVKLSLLIIEWQFRFDFIRHAYCFGLDQVVCAFHVTHRWPGMDVQIWILLAATQLILVVDCNCIRCGLRLIESACWVLALEIRHQLCGVCSTSNIL